MLVSDEAVILSLRLTHFHAYISYSIARKYSHDHGSVDKGAEVKRS